MVTCDGCYRNDLNGRWWCDNCDQWPCDCDADDDAEVGLTEQFQREDQT